MTDSELTVSISGASGPVSARVPALPVRRDDRGMYRFPYPDFGADFFPTLWDQMPLADRAGPPWRRRDTCFACETELAGAEAPRTITLEMSLRSVPDFEVEVGLPMVRCAACGELQAFEWGRSLEFNLSEALTRALDAAHVKP